MGRELNRAELDELVPLYALDALEGEEREQLARFVDRDPAARAEVDLLREAAAVFARDDTRAPASVWSGIEESLGGSDRVDTRRREPPALLPTPMRGTRRRRPGRVAVALVAAAAVVAIAVLAVQVVRQQHRIDDLAAAMHGDGASAAARAAMTAPGAHMVDLASTRGGRGAEIVMLANGQGYFMDSDLPPLPTSRTYQLWAEVGDAPATRMVSVGLLGRDPGVVAFRLSGPVTSFEVTREAAPGATEPADPLLIGPSSS
jgi:anti-sigma-K factor RskA